MILHVFWYAIPEMVSMLSIAICAVMIAVSFVLYGIRNIQVLKGG